MIDLKKNLVMINQMKWSMIACPCLIIFFFFLTRAIFKGLTLKKNVFDVCLCVNMFYVCIWTNFMDLT